MKVYLAGYMSGSCLEKCLSWRIKIREHYENWKGAGIKYPIDFLDPFNGPELDSLDAKGLKSSVPSNAIFSGDMMSVKACDLVVAHVDTFGEKREMIGTYFELGWCTAFGKPFILIAPESKKELCLNHPFLNKSANTFFNVEDFLDSKILNYYYKRINGANYKVEKV